MGFWTSPLGIAIVAPPALVVCVGGWVVSSLSTLLSLSASISPRDCSCKSARQHKSKRSSRSAQKIQTSVCVVGSGASGLVTAKTLRERGLHVVLFEATDNFGGLWQTSGVALARDTGCCPVHSNLHADLPKDFMAFSDHPFQAHAKNFPHHSEVLAYLQSYAERFDVHEITQFNSKVVSADFNTQRGVWRVVVAHFPPPTPTRVSQQMERLTTHEFTHLVVCTGHFNHPHMPHSPDFITTLPPHTVMHSSAFSTSKPFKNKRVLVVGSSVSALDVCIQLIRTEGCVVQCSIRSSRSPVLRFIHGLEVPILPRVESVEEIDGVVNVQFEDGVTRKFDKILLATGFEYSFPFLSDDIVNSIATPTPNDSTELLQQHKQHQQLLAQQANDTANAHESPQNEHEYAVIHRVGRLYGRVFYPENPTLAFVGLPNTLLPPWTVFEYQAHWIASVVCGSAKLPSRTAMEKEISLRETKALSPAHRDIVGFATPTYCHWLAVEAGCAHGYWWQLFQFRLWRMMYSWLWPPIRAKFYRAPATAPLAQKSG